MKWVIINDTSIGGAYRAAKNYSLIINEKYRDSAKLVNLHLFNLKRKESKHYSLISRATNKILKKFLIPRAKRYFTFSRKHDRTKLLKYRSSMNEIVNVHWLGNSIVNLNYLCTVENMIIVTMHDMWFLTGGCHLPGTCHGFQQNCYDCPDGSVLIGRSRIRKENILKRQFLLRDNVKIIVPSLWLKTKVEETLGKNCELIHNPFVPESVPTKAASRSKLDIGKDVLVIMMSAVGIDEDTNKARDLKTLVKKILAILPDKRVEFILVGSKRKLQMRNCHIYPLIYSEQAMANFYNAADVFLMTSESENSPYSIIEACYYGAFPVAYDVGGIKEILDISEFGKVVPLHDIDQMITEMLLFVENNEAPKYTEVKANIIRGFGPDRFLKCIKELLEK